jgi:hypothetical protein
MTKPSKKPGKTENLRGKGNSGRPKGATNKVTRELKEMILGALDAAGGADYLTERANDPRTASAFLSLVGKVLPMTVQGAGANGSHVFEVIERRIVRAGT